MAHSTERFQRPLSPHLQVYAMSVLMVASISHRITGAINYTGTALVVWWLVALASGPDAYATFQWAAGSPLGLLVLFGYTWSLMHHMMGGIRHLIWDTGSTMAPAPATRLTLVGVGTALLLTVLIWAVALLGAWRA
jgi:succinate dehydrogenase / fumarate reductase cytochrome b subunit